LPQFMIPCHIDTGGCLRDFRCLRSPDLLPRLRRLSRCASPMPETGAKVSTIIFCDVSLRLSQSIDLNILRARLISFDLDQGTMKVTLRSFPGRSGFIPMIRNLDRRSLLACSVQHLSSAARSNLGLLRALISSLLLPFQTLKT